MVLPQNILICTGWCDQYHTSSSHDLTRSICQICLNEETNPWYPAGRKQCCDPGLTENNAMTPWLWADRKQCYDPVILDRQKTMLCTASSWPPGLEIGNVFKLIYYSLTCIAKVHLLNVLARHYLKFKIWLKFYLHHSLLSACFLQVLLMCCLLPTGFANGLSLCWTGLLGWGGWFTHYLSRPYPHNKNFLQGEN